MVCLRARFSTSCLGLSGVRVMGDLGFFLSAEMMATRSNELPSGSMTGSRMIS